MPEMVETPNSSNIYAVGHDADTNTLHVTFRNASDKPSNTFTYSKVTPEQHQDMMSADSAGSWFHEHIKKHPDKHPASKRE
jgi:hypothetical protein